MRSSTDTLANLSVIALAVALLISLFCAVPTWGHGSRPLSRDAAGNSDPCEPLEIMAADTLMRWSEPRLSEWDLEVQSLHAVHLDLVEEQLRLAREIAGAGAELRLASRLRSDHRAEIIAWRRVEASTLKAHLRAKLADLESERDVMSQRYADGSVWRRRIDAIVDAAQHRMEQTPGQLETGRVMVRDPVGSVLDAIMCQAEIYLESCGAKDLLIREQLREVRSQLDALRFDPSGSVVTADEPRIHF